MLYHTHLKWYANLTLLKATMCKNKNNSSTNLLQYCYFGRLWAYPIILGHDNPKIWQFLQFNYTHTYTHTHTHTHTHTNQSNSSTHCWDISNSYFSTLSTPTKIWQFTIKMVVTSKVALKKHLYKAAHKYSLDWNSI